MSETSEGALPSALSVNGARARRAIIAAVAGNTLEWYDFVVYAFMAPTISKLFFPAGDETVSLLLTFATFGVGFVMRPVGAIVLGGAADKMGRKKILLATILLMGLGTGIIAICPTYASIGWWAPLLIVVARLIQGFSAGGELGSATAFIMEHSDPRGRGLAASWQQASQAATLLLGTLIGASISGFMSNEVRDAWGWRVPFAIGLLIVPVGFYIRRQIDETPEFLSLEGQNRRNPLAQLLLGHSRQVIAGLGLVIVWTVSTYFFLIYMPTYAVRQLHLPQTSSLLANGVALATLMVLAPVFGWASDRIGRKPLLLTGAIAICVMSYPLIALLTRWPSLPALVSVQVVIAVFIAVFTGPAPVALGELYPTSVRSSGMSLAYNIAAAVFGGFAPFISTWLIANTGDGLAPAYYVTVCAVLSLVALLFMKETAPARTHS